MAVSGQLVTAFDVKCENGVIANVGAIPASAAEVAPVTEAEGMVGVSKRYTGPALGLPVKKSGDPAAHPARLLDTYPGKKPYLPSVHPRQLVLLVGWF